MTEEIIRYFQDGLLLITTGLLVAYGVYTLRETRDHYKENVKKDGRDKDKIRELEDSLR